jgi:hypothetical protein
LTGHINRQRLSTPLLDDDKTGANLHTEPTIQQNVYGLLTVTPRLTLDYAVYDEDTAGNSMPMRFGYSFGISANTNFYRLFNVNLFSIHGMLHTVRPYVSYTYTPDFDFGRFPTVTGIPQFGETNSLSFGINQKVDAKIGSDLKKNTLLRVDAVSGYNVLTDSFSTIAFTTELPYNPFPKPITRFHTQLRGSVDPYTKEYSYTVNNTTGFTLDFFSVSVNQSYTKDGTYQVWFNGDLKPTKNWSISYSARYDWDTRKLVDYNINVKRNLHCWKAEFSFNQLGETWRYDFKVYITDIPDVSICK